VAQRQAAEDVLVRHLATGQTMMVPRATLRAAPDEYQTVHNAFVEPTPLEVACASLLAHKTTWRLPDLEAEREEFERAGKLVGVPGDALLEAARTAPTVVLSDAMWSTMQNTDSWGTDTIDKAIEYARLYDKDIRDLILGLGGSMETPMVIQRPDGSTVLVGGNTRLMTFRAFGLRPRVLLVPQPQAKIPLYEDKNMPRDPAFEFKHALTVRNVVARFVEASTEKTATTFPTQEALDAYLKKHPKADKSKHTVGKPGGKGKPEKKEESKGQESGGESGGDKMHKHKGDAGAVRDLSNKLYEFSQGGGSMNEIARALEKGEAVSKKKIDSTIKSLEQHLDLPEGMKLPGANPQKVDHKKIKSVIDGLKSMSEE
jgi:hypothetical protein